MAPFFIPILALIASMIILKSKDENDFNSYLIKIFLFGIVLITFTEVCSKYAGINLKINFLLAFSPILLSAIILFYIIKKLEFKND